MTDIGGELYREAIASCQALLERAKQTTLNEPTAATLATVDERGQPSARIVLVRRYDESGFVFFTNSESRKGSQLASHPQAALCFHWDPLQEQLRVEGRVEPAQDSESDDYWRRRPRESQIGAWASDQSRVLESRQLLEERVRYYELHFAGREVPRPPHWHGYRVVPRRIEFWRGVVARLHERIVYESTDSGWRKYLLFP